jgi:hypothetical protein
MFQRRKAAGRARMQIKAAAKPRAVFNGRRLKLKFPDRLCYTSSHAKKDFSEQRHGGAGADDLRARPRGEHEEGDCAHR